MIAAVTHRTSTGFDCAELAPDVYYVDGYGVHSGAAMLKFNVTVTKVDSDRRMAFDDSMQVQANKISEVAHARTLANP